MSDPTVVFVIVAKESVLVSISVNLELVVVSLVSMLPVSVSTAARVVCVANPAPSEEMFTSTLL